jgi:adenosylcobinamide amidohydrolase
MSSKPVQLFGFNDTNKHFQKVHVNSSGALSVDGSFTISGGSTEAKQDTQITSLSNIDSNITACNTGAVVISSSALPSGAASESTLSSVNSKITACDTGAVVVSSSALPLGAASESTLSSMNLKVTACDTGAVVVSSSALPSGAASESTLSSMNSKITACDTGAVVISDFTKGQGLMSASFPVVLASNQSDVNVKLNDCKNVGSHNNISNNVTINFGNNSSVVDISDIRHGNLFYEDSSTSSFGAVDIEVSVDGTNYVKYADLNPFEENSSGVRTASSTGMNLEGLTNIRLKNSSVADNYTNVKAFIVGSP